MESKTLKKEVIVAASPDDVWRAWTTTEGVVAFFAPEASVDLRIGGEYELYFDLDAPLGERGSEGAKVLSYLPSEMLCFSWNAPPEMPEVRRERTWVVVRLEPARSGSTRVRIDHLGWGRGDQWDQARAYFDRAWDIVLRRLRDRFESGPIDWSSI